MPRTDNKPGKTVHACYQTLANIHSRIVGQGVKVIFVFEYFIQNLNNFNFFEKEPYFFQKKFLCVFKE